MVGLWSRCRSRRSLLFKFKVSIPRGKHSAQLRRPPQHQALFLSSMIKSDGSTKNEVGYSYHNINMKALPMDLVPEVNSFASELATEYKLPDNKINIGVDLIVYKDGSDSIGWHADDTQGEDLVLAVVVESHEMRPLKIRPAKSKSLSDGDEEIELFIGEGDAYAMDRLMQEGYEHCLPKKENVNSHRLVMIFRHGDVRYVPGDNGENIIEWARRNKQSTVLEDVWDAVPLITQLRIKLPSVQFGHPTNIREGECKSRHFLFSEYAHRADQRGINGKITVGSDSIVVSRQSSALREKDGLDRLLYTAS
jgi:hypothetical protein